MNPQYFIDNSTSLDTISDVNGYTTVFTATAVQCGETYHIRLSIADGSDGLFNPYVGWRLEVLILRHSMFKIILELILIKSKLHVTPNNSNR